MEDNLSFDFSFDVAGRIWQLRADSNSMEIALEVRDAEDQSISFLVFDLNSFEISDYLEIPGTDWWTTLFGIESGKLTLLKYEDQQDISKKTFLEYDVAQDTIQMLADVSESRPGNNMISPYLSGIGTETFELCKEYLDEDIYLGVEYLELGSNIIFTYYIRSGAKFERYLLVNRDGEEICRVLQDSNLDGFASGSFFILDKYLIFIKDSKQVNGIKI